MEIQFELNEKQTVVFKETVQAANDPRPLNEIAKDVLVRAIIQNKQALIANELGGIK